MEKKASFFLLLFFSLSITINADARWYVSNAAGQSLKPAYSLTALREKYALSIIRLDSASIPEDYARYYAEDWKVECRTLYGGGELLRTQWVFIDDNSVTRFVAAASPAGAGFTEVYDKDGLLIEETRFDAPTEKIITNDDGEEITTTVKAAPFKVSYSYKSGFLVEAKSDEWRDIYRYTRENQIRLIDRTYNEPSSTTRISFPRSIKDISFTGNFFVSPALAYSSVFLKDILVKSSTESIYTTDSKGRILSEQRVDESGKNTGLLKINWEGNIINSVEWEEGADKRRIEYFYNKDDERTKEIDYRNGALEREVVFQGDNEVETLYLDGKPVLKATWNDGIKTSEENLLYEGGARRRVKQ